MFQVNTVFGGSFFLSASLVNKPCCFHSPYITVRFFLTLEKVLPFPMMLKRANVKHYGQARSICSSLPIVACRGAKPSASGHRGLILQWALCFQGELPVRNTWRWWEPLISSFSAHACMSIQMDVRTCRCVRP